MDCGFQFANCRLSYLLVFPTWWPVWRFHALPRWRRWRWRWWSSQCLPSFVQPPARVAEDRSDRCPKFLSCLLKKEAYTTSSRSKDCNWPLGSFQKDIVAREFEIWGATIRMAISTGQFFVWTSSKQAFFVGSRREFWACGAVTEQPVNDVLSKMEIGICTGALSLKHKKATTVVMWIDGGIGISDITCLNMPKCCSWFLQYILVSPADAKWPCRNVYMELWNMMILGC